MQTQNILPVSIRILKNIKRFVMRTLILFLVSNFRIITLGLLVLAFWKPFEAIAILLLLILMILTRTKGKVWRVLVSGLD